MVMKRRNNEAGENKINKIKYFLKIMKKKWISRKY